VRPVSFLKAHRESIQIWTDSLSHVFQIVAILAAGIWTYRSFYLTEKPSLEPRGATTSTLAWDKVPYANDTCLGVFEVNFTNSGKRSIEVKGVQIEGWIVDQFPTTQKPRYIDVDELARGGVLFAGGRFKSTLQAHYPPNANKSDTFIWQFRKQDKKFVLLKVTLQTDPPQDESARSSYSWNDLCGASDSAAELQPR
jgi:hypothetical protein